jgi:hypothetical protein
MAADSISDLANGSGAAIVKERQRERERKG